MKPLRFCHFTTFYPPYNFGGDGIGIQRLCRALGDTAVHLALEQHRVEHRAGVVARDLTQQPDLTGSGVDLDDRDVGAERE